MTTATSAKLSPSVRSLPASVPSALALALTLVLTPTLALASPAADADADSPRVTTRVSAKGVVTAEVKVAASAKAVRALLSGAEKAHGLAPTTVSSKATPDGKCEKVKLQTRGLISPFVLETRRCPTATGWRETLVSSENFIEYWNEWTVKDLGDGALVTFKTRTLPNVAVPESLILSQTRRVLGKLMKNLLGALGEG